MCSCLHKTPTVFTSGDVSESQLSRWWRRFIATAEAQDRLLRSLVDQALLPEPVQAAAAPAQQQQGGQRQQQRGKGAKVAPAAVAGDAPSQAACRQSGAVREAAAEVLCCLAEERDGAGRAALRLLLERAWGAGKEVLTLSRGEIGLHELYPPFFCCRWAVPGRQLGVLLVVRSSHPKIVGLQLFVCLEEVGVLIYCQWLAFAILGWTSYRV